jgi:uncharacterized membrane protein YqjE
MADEIAMTRAPTGNGQRNRVGTLSADLDERAAAEPGLGDLFRQLAQDSATLVRQEVALAKAELRENVSHAVRDAVMIAVGGVIALIGVLVLVAFLVLALGDALENYWLSSLIVGAVFLIAGGVLAMGSLRKLKRDGLAPERTIQTLKEDKQWAQNEIRQARQDLA